MGLGLIFHGSELMGGTYPRTNPCHPLSLGFILALMMLFTAGAFGFLKTNQNFLDFLAKLSNTYVGCFTGLALTGLVQSSGAALGIFLNLAQQGLLKSHTGIAMTLGANVGTCLTALLAAIGQGEGPMRVAVALTLARAVGALLCCFWIVPLEYFSMLTCRLDPTAKIISPDDTASIIAASHTIFNIALCAAVVPFSEQYARFVKKMVPVKDKSEDPEDGPEDGHHLLDIKQMDMERGVLV